MSSRTGFGIKEVRQLVDKSQILPTEIPEAIGGLVMPLQKDNLSKRSSALLKFFQPVIEQTDWSAMDGHNPKYAKAFETTKQVLAAHAMLNRLRGGIKGLASEATTAGVDLPTFTRQLLLTITRAYARLFTLELFGVIPLNQPTGRIHFKDYLYDSTFNGSVPNVAQGARTDDITQFNPDYYLAPEGEQANRIRFHYTNLDVSVKDYRVIAEWTDSLADDAMSVYDDDAEQSHMDHMAQEMARVVDRSMLGALISAVPAGNQYTWTSQPTSNPNYASLTPSESAAWDERLYKDGINTTISKIRTTRKYNNDGDPDFMVVGTDFALRLNKLSMVVPFDNFKEIDLRRGALRDLGELRGLNIRVLVDPMLAQTVTKATGASNGQSMAFFGRRPAMRNDVGIYWLPYINLQPTRDLYDPQTGTTVRGVRSRFAIAQPNTGTQPNSSQLGEIYGQLTVQ